MDDASTNTIQSNYKTVAYYSRKSNLNLNIQLFTWFAVSQKTKRITFLELEVILTVTTSIVYFFLSKSTFNQDI